MTYRYGHLSIEHDRATSGKVIIVSGPRACGKTTYIRKEIEKWKEAGVACVHMVEERPGNPVRADGPDWRSLDQLVADRSIGQIYIEKGE